MSADELCINDVSLRDGIQSESTFIPMPVRLEIVKALLDAGVKSLQVASFVNPKRVPQMQGIESFIDLLPNKESVLYSALVLNEEGLRRLRETDIKQADISISCSDTHSRRNTKLSLVEARNQALAMIASAKKTDLSVRVGLQCVFGCHDEGRIPLPTILNLVRDFTSAGCDSISLADSTGQALPEDIRSMISAVQDISDRPIILHLHDTLGLGIANFISGYQAGVRDFDASLGGVGGCPFIPGASGNVALEDIVHLCNRLELSTGIDLDRVLEATRLLETALNYPLPGKIHRILRQRNRKEAAVGTDSLAKNPES